MPKRPPDQKGAGAIPLEIGRGPMLTTSIQVNSLWLRNSILQHFFTVHVLLRNVSTFTARNLRWLNSLYVSYIVLCVLYIYIYIYIYIERERERERDASSK
jgi:Ca2+/Na+ antiporter